MSPTSGLMGAPGRKTHTFMTPKQEGECRIQIWQPATKTVRNYKIVVKKWDWEIKSKILQRYLIFNKFKIDKKSFSFNDHNERIKLKYIIEDHNLLFKLHDLMLVVYIHYNLKSSKIFFLKNITIIIDYRVESMKEPWLNNVF